MPLRLSQLEKKKEHRLKAMQKKIWWRISNLESILAHSKTFGINLPEATIKEIKDKIKYYTKETFKISDVWNWRFNDKYQWGLGRWTTEPSNLKLPKK